MTRRPVGVLALQGAFAAHERRIREAGGDSVQIRVPEDLAGIAALVLPGGESTTMSMLLESSGLLTAVADRIDEGLPVLGTCAGMILLAREVLDGRPDQRCLGAVDLVVRRNGYGRQRDSFETDLRLLHRPPGEAPFRGVFIRAPRIERWGAEVEVLAEHDGVPVLVRQGNVTVASFHPELTPDTRVHEEFLEHRHTEAL